MVQSDAEAGQAKCSEAEKAKGQLASRLSDPAQEISTLKACLQQKKDAVTEKEVLTAYSIPPLFHITRGVCGLMHMKDSLSFAILVSV